MPNNTDKQAIIDTLVPFIIAFVEPRELMLDLCSVSDGDMTRDELWRKWDSALGNLGDTGKRQKPRPASHKRR